MIVMGLVAWALGALLIWTAFAAALPVFLMVILVILGICMFLVPFSGGW